MLADSISMNTAQANTHRVRASGLARMLGITRQSVADLVRRGIIERGVDGLIDVETARFAISSRVRPSGKTAQSVGASSPAAPPQEQRNMSYWQAKTQRESAEALMAELQYRKMCGELVDVSSVRSAITAKAIALRDALLQLPDRTCQALAAETDPHLVREYLSGELRSVLEQVTSPV